MEVLNIKIILNVEYIRNMVVSYEGGVLVSNKTIEDRTSGIDIVVYVIKSKRYILSNNNELYFLKNVSLNFIQDTKTNRNMNYSFYSYQYLLSQYFLQGFLPTQQNSMTFLEFC